MALVDVPAFGAWSLLSLTTTAHGAPVYPDELGVRYVSDLRQSVGVTTQLL
jgi:hypothetical protein